MSSMQPQPVVINLGNAGAGATRSGRLIELAQKTWLTADQKEAVADGDPRARFLLGIAGEMIPEEQAIELGLIEEEDEPEPEKARIPTENKKRTPSQNK